MERNVVAIEPKPAVPDFGWQNPHDESLQKLEDGSHCVPKNKANRIGVVNLANPGNELHYG